MSRSCRQNVGFFVGVPEPKIQTRHGLGPLNQRLNGQLSGLSGFLKGRAPWKKLTLDFVYFVDSTLFSPKARVGAGEMNRRELE